MSQTILEQFALSLYENGHLQGNGDEIQDLLEKYKAMEKARMIQFAYEWSSEQVIGEDIVEDFEKTYGGKK